MPFSLSSPSGPPVPADRLGAVSEATLARWRLLIGCALGLALVAGVVMYLLHQRDLRLAAAEDRLRSLAAALANAVEHAFDAAERLHRGHVARLGLDGAATLPEEAEVVALLGAHGGAQPWMAGLLLFDAAGAVRARSPELPQAEAPALAASCLAALDGAPSAGLVPGLPIPVGTPPRELLCLAQGIAAPTGGLAAGLGALIDLGSMGRLFDRLALLPGEQVGLHRLDGQPLLRRSAGDAPGLETSSDAPEAHLLVRQELIEHGLAVVTSLPRAVPIAQWWLHHLRPTLGIALLGSAMLLVLWLTLRDGRQRRAMLQLRAAWSEAEAERARAEARAHEARETAARDTALAAVFVGGTAGIAEVDLAAHRYLRVNRRFCEITGRGEAELLGGLGPVDLTPPEDRETERTLWLTAMARGNHWDAEKRYLRPDGSVAWARISVAVSARSDAGVPLRSIAIVQDITASREAEARRRESEALLRLSMQIGRIGSFTLDFATRTIQCGPETRAIAGLPAGKAPIPVDTWFAHVVAEDREQVIAAGTRATALRQPEVALAYRLRQPDAGHLRHVEMRARFVYDEAGQPVSLTGAVIDQTERHEAEARIAHLAKHDALTDLPNRLLFRERLDAALARAQRKEGFALLYLDLDRFKEVNDTLGHPVGDALLRAVTARLQAELREIDTLARLGGDEFAIVQSNVQQPAAAIGLANRLVTLLAEPFELDGHQVGIGTSIGIALAPQDGLDADLLLKNADLALYRAKADGRGGWRFFEPEMDARMRLRRALETDLRRAIEHDEFTLLYQPILDLQAGRVGGLEALLRWHHPERGLIGPDAFVPLAEEIGLMVPIGEWALARACRDAAAWPDVPRISVNVSPVQFATRNLMDAVTMALGEARLDPARLELEITEKVMLRETEGTLGTLHRLKALGLRIALDDFGTGYSSLSYLQRFPFDRVKIDRCFISAIDSSPQSAAIVRAVSSLCAGLGMQTTAEGVETERQLRALLREGCQEAQGYLFSRPLQATEVPEMLARLQGWRLPAAAET